MMKFTHNLQAENNKMSIYSGFATRFQQQAYDHCVDSLIYILQKRIIKFYQKEQADEEKFVALVLKLHHQLKSMEKNKYLDPKSSRSIQELVKFIPQLNPSSFSNPQPSANLQPTSPPQPPPQQLPAPLPEIVNEKKKSSLWVQKQPVEVESVKTVTEQEVQTLGTINKQAHSDSMQNNQPFKRTQYHPPNIRAFNQKATSRSNLSRQRKDEAASGLLESEQNGRSMSNYLQEKPQIHSKVTYYPSSAHSNHLQKRKSLSNTRVHPAVEQNNENHNEVADIIKDYIVKVKRGYNRMNKGKDFRNSINKLQDF